MTPEMIQNYVNTTIAFLNRTQLNGAEAETLVELKRWLVSLTKPPVTIGESNDA